MSNFYKNQINQIWAENRLNELKLIKPIDDGEVTKPFYFSSKVSLDMAKDAAEGNPLAEEYCWRNISSKFNLVINKLFGDRLKIHLFEVDDLQLEKKIDSGYSIYNFRVVLKKKFEFFLC